MARLPNNFRCFKIASHVITIILVSTTFCSTTPLWNKCSFSVFICTSRLVNSSHSTGFFILI